MTLPKKYSMLFGRWDQLQIQRQDRTNLRNSMHTHEGEAGSRKGLPSG